jgi:DNA polymerase III delta prime subunit
MDFSFMKSGRASTNSSSNNTNDILNMLELFTSNALKNSSRYVDLCGRNGITPEDIKYGLIYEVFEFFNRPNNLQDLRDIESLNKEEMDISENIDDNIVEDSELDIFKRIDIETIINEEDIAFVVKLYSYYDNWDTWEPKTMTEQIIQNAINKIKL